MMVVLLSVRVRVYLHSLIADGIYFIFSETVIINTTKRPQSEYGRSIMSLYLIYLTT
jgi:hypothetical protein